jgi:hypothetical protein
MIQTASRHWALQIWLDNMELGLDPPCLNLRDGLRIRRVLKKERDIRYAGRTIRFDLEIDSQSCMIETLVTSEREPWESREFMDASREQLSVLGALLLFRDSLIKPQYRMVVEGELTAIGGHEEYVDQSLRPLWINSVSLHHRSPFGLHLLDREKLPRFWNGLDTCQKQAPFLQTSLDRFCLASEVVGDPGREAYRLVDYVACLEALLTQNAPELSFKLRSRMATLLGESPKESQDVFDFMKEVYEVRSDLVHGEELKKVLPLRVRETEIEFHEAVGRLHSYCHHCISLAVELIEAGFGNKEKMLRLLDLAGLRSDLQESLASFLHGRQGGKKLRDDFATAEDAPFCRTLREERGGA